MSEEEQIILPEGYRRVEYLESSGSQYINTKIKPNKNTGTYVKALCTSSSSTYNVDGSGDYLMTPGIKGGNTAGFVYNIAWYGISGFLTADIFEGSINWFNNRKATLDTVNNFYSRDVSVANRDISPWYLYIFNPAGFPDYKGCFRIYRYKVSENEEVVLDFIPVLDTNGKPCMYDLVSKKTFYNSGTGSFVWPFSEEDYKPVPYLISNGNQRIDTGYIPKKNSGFWIDAQALYEGDRLVMGSGPNSNNSSMTALRVPGTNGSTTSCYWNVLQSFETLGAGRRFVSETNFKNNLKANLYIDADFVGSKDLTPFISTPTYSVYLFGSNNNGSNNSPWIGKIYRAKISEGDKIIHDYIPMIDPIGRPLMYDIIEKKAHYTNNLSNNFIIPKNIEISYVNKDYNLPAGYTRCVYLQSDDKQYINTGIVPNDETGLSVKGELMSINTNESIYMGSIEDTTGCRCTPLYFTNATNGQMGYNWNTSSGVILYNRTPDREFYSSLNLYNNRHVYYSSKHINYLNTLTKTLGNFVQPIWLFTYNSRGSYNSDYGNWQGKIFRAQITQGDTLVRDFVPCLDENKKPCMFDLISQTPFYNQGTGKDFTYCVEHSLPSDFVKLKYLESFGKQYIKTGHIPTENTGLYVEAYHTGKIINTGGLCLGLRQSSVDNTYFAAPRVTTFWSVCYGWNNAPDLGGTYNTKYEGWMNWLNSKKVLVASPLFADKTANITTSLTFTPTEDLYLFYINPVYDKSAIGNSSWRIYRAKISEGDQIVRDFVPAFDDVKQKPCVYDLINNVAYYNDGEGEFLYNTDFEGTYEGFGTFATIGNKLGFYINEDTEE